MDEQGIRVKGENRRKKQETVKNKWVVHGPLGIPRDRLSKKLFEFVNGGSPKVKKRKGRK